MSTPVESSKPALWPSFGAMSMCQWKASVPRGAVRTQRFSSSSSPKRARSARSAVASAADADLAVVLEARRRSRGG